MKLSIISFTNNGLELSKKVSESLMENTGITTAVYTKCSLVKKHDTKIKAVVVEKSIADWTKEQMQEKNAILFIGACGIAVRAIAPNLTDKLHDSPVLVLDEQGQYVIPLLAGHFGGANELAVQIAEKIHAIPVITTATDLQNKFAVDLFAKRNGLHIINKDGIAKVSAKVLAGEKVTMCVEEGHLKEGTKIPEEIRLISYPSTAGLSADYIPTAAISADFTSMDSIPTVSALTFLPSQNIDIVIAENPNPEQSTNTDALLRLQPKEYVIGMGCKRGTKPQKIEAMIDETLKTAGMKKEQIFALASIDKKQDEQGFLIWSRQHRVPFLTYTAEELQKVQGNFHASAFVESQVGVDNVCERAALCACEAGGTLVYEKHAKDGMTIAVAKREWRITFDEA